MKRPALLDPSAVDLWLGGHLGWSREGNALVKQFKTDDFAGALALAVRIGMLAERRDHHPEILLGWGKLRVLWTTHDAGGITDLDLELAAASDAAHG